MEIAWVEAFSGIGVEARSDEWGKILGAKFR
jgi:hypothetical protein